MFRASSAHLQEDTVVHMQHMVLSLSTKVPGGLSVNSLSEILSAHSCCMCTTVSSWRWAFEAWNT